MPRSVVAVVGAEGRIGHLIMGMADQNWRPLAVTRTLDAAGLGREVQADRFPILVCTRNDDVPAVVAMVHPERHADLVFMQNGMISPWLQAHGLGGCTRGVLWVAVPRRGDRPVPGGVSVFHGPWAKPVAELLDGHGVDTRAVSRAVRDREVSVKLGWICVYGVLGSALGVSVGDIAADHADDVRVLSDELHPLLVKNVGLDLSADALFERLQTYSAQIPHFSASVKEWRWRNGWQQSAGAAAAIAMPHFEAWLQRAGGPPA